MKRFCIAISLLIIFLLHTPLDAHKIGYALSGGGARGFAQIGMLKVLEENGIYPDYISGTSIGAVVGALYAMGYNASEIEAMALSIDWQSVFQDTFERKELYIGQKRWPPYGNLLFEMDERWTPQLPQSVYAANNINLELFRFFVSTSKVQRFDQLPIPFSCVATNLLTGEMRIFDDGSLMQAVKASMSIPSIMKPFHLADSLYIDGGISQNLPAQKVRDMGADFVIGMKTSSSLRSQDKINNLFQVFDQTVNIGITQNVLESIPLCDIILSPDLDGFNSAGFNQIQEIIDNGESYARDHLSDIISFRDSCDLAPQRFKPHSRIEPLYTLKISKISVKGNQFISSTKIREYIDIDTGSTLSINAIVQKFRQAWNLQLFHFIYPTLLPDGDAYQLIIHVQERERKHAALNNAYTSEDGMVVGIVLALNNFLSRNSLLLAEAKLGGKNELNLDFVRNFGEHWGIYYRLYPYISEKTLYMYEDHNKTNSIGSLETGLSTGIGVFAGKIAALESYAFHYHTQLYRKIASSESHSQSYSITGLGVKLYHESLDDFYYPMNGKRFFGKLSFSRNFEKSPLVYGKFISVNELYIPFLEDFSLMLALDYGANFDKEDNLAFDPFYLGGIDGFYGYQKYEKSAPFFKIYELGMRYQAIKNTFFELGVQGLNFANSDIWSAHQEVYFCGYLGFGRKTLIGPLGIMLSLSESKRFYAHLNLGYYKDLYQFSRR